MFYIYDDCKGKTFITKDSEDVRVNCINSILIIETDDISDVVEFLLYHGGITESDAQECINKLEN